MNTVSMVKPNAKDSKSIALSVKSALDKIKNTENNWSDTALKRVDNLLSLLSEEAPIISVIDTLLDLSDDDVITLTPLLATRILKEANFPRQRPIKAARVKKHRMRVDQGNWRGQDFAITFARIPATASEPERLWLINGQHRVSMISEYDKPLPVKVHIAKAENESNAALLYTYFDTPDEVRTDVEVLDARGIIDDIDVPRTLIKIAYSALALVRNDLEPAYYQNCEIARDREGRMADIRNWSGEIVDYWANIKDADGFLKRKLFSVGVTAFALYVFRYKTEKAASFFGGMANNNGLKKTDPRSRLIADLSGNRKKGDSRKLIQSCSIAWNAFCENREIQVIKIYPNAKIKVWGTPLANPKASQQ